MMNYEEFKEKVIAEFLDFATPDVNKDLCKIDSHKVAKQNSILDSLSVLEEGDKKVPCVCPTLYINALYKSYEEGIKFDDIMKKAWNVINEYKTDLAFDIKSVFIPENIIPCIINKNENVELLKNSPHRNINDEVAVYYRLCINSNQEDEKSFSTIMSTELVNSYFNDMSEEQLYLTAVKNIGDPERYYNTNDLFYLSQAVGLFFNLSSSDVENSKKPCILNVRSGKNYGANCILFLDFLENKIKKVQEENNYTDYCIVLDSVDNIMVFFDVEDDFVRETLRKINRNSSLINKEDVLSDEIFIIKEGKLIIK